MVNTHAFFSFSFMRRASSTLHTKCVMESDVKLMAMHTEKSRKETDGMHQHDQLIRDEYLHWMCPLPAHQFPPWHNNCVSLSIRSFKTAPSINHLTSLLFHSGFFFVYSASSGTQQHSQRERAKKIASKCCDSLLANDLKAKLQCDANLTKHHRRNNERRNRKTNILWLICLKVNRIQPTRHTHEFCERWVCVEFLA